MALSMITSDRRFWPLFWTQFFGALNDNVFKNALVMMVTFQSVTIWGLDKAQIVALSGGLFILPFFLFSPLAGQISDKMEKSQLVRITKYWEFMIMLVASVGFFFHAFQMLLVVLFLAGVQAALFGPVKYSLLPDLVKPTELIEVNAYIEMGTFLAILIGTIVGGQLVRLPHSEILISVVLLFFALSGVATSLFVQKIRAAAPDLVVRYNPIPNFKSLLQILRSKRALFNSVLGISWFWFFGAAVLSILPVYCKDFLNVDENVVTCFLAMFTIGIGIGSVACEKLSFGRVELGLVPIGSLGMSVFLTDLYFATLGWSADHTVTLSEFLNRSMGPHLMVDFFFMSVFGGFFILPLYTLLQVRSAHEQRSRVIAANNIMNALFMVVASVTVMVFNALHLNQPQMFLCLAIMNVLAAIYIYTVVPEFTLRLYAWILAHLIYRIRAEGDFNVPKHGPAVLVCNHVSFIDWLVISALVPRPVRFVMYYKFFDIPLARFLMKQARVIPICGARENTEMLNEAFERISAELRDQEVICIFPEGKLTRDGQMDSFRNGIERILQRDPVPVIPMALNGLWGTYFTYGGGLMNWSRPRHWRTRVRLVIGSSLAAGDATAKNLEQRVRELTAKV